MSLTLNVEEIINKFANCETDLPKTTRVNDKFYTFDIRNYITLFKCKDNYSKQIIQTNINDDSNKLRLPYLLSKHYVERTV